MVKREREVRDVIEDVYDVLAGVEQETSIEVCLAVLVDLLGSSLTTDDLRQFIDEARSGHEYG